MRYAQRYGRTTRRDGGHQTPIRHDVNCAVAKVIKVVTSAAVRDLPLIGLAIHSLEPGCQFTEQLQSTKHPNQINYESVLNPKPLPLIAAGVTWLQNIYTLTSGKGTAARRLMS